MWCARHDSNVRPSESETEKSRLHSLAHEHKVKYYMDFLICNHAQIRAASGE